jgi:hypothetical protein
MVSVKSFQFAQISFRENKYLWCLPKHLAECPLLDISITKLAVWLQKHFADFDHHFLFPRALGELPGLLILLESIHVLNDGRWVKGRN